MKTWNNFDTRLKTVLFIAKQIQNEKSKEPILEPVFSTENIRKTKTKEQISHGGENTIYFRE